MQIIPVVQLKHELWNNNKSPIPPTPLSFLQGPFPSPDGWRVHGRGVVREDLPPRKNLNILWKTAVCVFIFFLHFCSGVELFAGFSANIAGRIMVGSQMASRDMKLSLSSFFSRRSFTRDDGEEILKEYYIPDYVLVPEAETKEQCDVPECPVVVFVNAKSGGQLGGELLLTFRRILNKNQVFDLGDKAPDKVLHQLYFNLEKHKRNGDDLSSEILRKLRVIVAGGDGTAGWLLGVVSDLKLSHPPPIATMPLGTGNNIPFSFGWGKRNPGTNYQSVKAFLEQVKHAKEMKVDSWHILMRMKAPKEGPCDPIGPLDLPHSLHAFNRVSPADEMNEEGYHTFRGGFWNYFSMGMDAQVSYAFHSKRKLHPEKFKNQFVNQTTYAKISCKQGWFCSSLKHPSSRNIARLAKVKIMKKPGEWIDLRIPRSIRSIVCINLPSFSGGLNPWGRPSKQKLHSRDLTPPYVDDGFFEVVGFRDAWHGLILFAPNGHGTRLAQANRICFEFQKGATTHTFMRIDGEPWKQPLPMDDDTVIIEISHFGQVSVLANLHCQSRSINMPYSPYSPHGSEDDGSNSNEELSLESSEERKKFGAADTFKLPDDFNIDCLSRPGFPAEGSQPTYNREFASDISIH